ncbi:hypothetical protein DRO33_05405, partial [Candidatus Bathyarchaeota archaeon]
MAEEAIRLRLARERARAYEQQYKDLVKGIAGKKGWYALVALELLKISSELEGVLADIRAAAEGLLKELSARMDEHMEGHAKLLQEHVVLLRQSQARLSGLASTLEKVVPLVEEELLPALEGVREATKEARDVIEAVREDREALGHLLELLKDIKGGLEAGVSDVRSL